MYLKECFQRFPNLFPYSISLHEYLKLDYNELLTVCESLDINLTDEMAHSVEKETTLQSNSKLWFTYRAGRVTASRMKAVCRTDNSKPSQSLIITICFPQSFCFQVNKQQTTSHEQFAKEQYT